ncbi:hypothetical protein DENSPDRAFT_845599 [Dentipellis sp. KUC8613]|nr:hypothetical protein DENSPDRAFT_845599 [Dentipellis sp. KUC8613]
MAPPHNSMHNTGLAEIYASLPSDAKLDLLDRLLPLVDAIADQTSHGLLDSVKLLGNCFAGMPDLDYDGKTAELAGLWDGYNAAQIRGLNKDATRRAELLRECIESVLTDWLNDIWSVAYEFQTEFELVHKCLKFAADTVGKVATTKHSACDCFCSTYNLILTLERRKSKGSVCMFHLRSIESFYLPLLWVWRDMILTMLSYGQERHKKLLPEMLDDIRRAVGWGGLEYLSNGGIKFDDHDETYGPACESEWLREHRRSIETLTPRLAPNRPEYWSAAIKASMPDLLACIDAQMLDYFNEHPDQALYRRILRMTTPSRREAVENQLRRTLYDYAYLSSDCFAVALDLFTQDRVFDKVFELLFKGAHLLRLRDKPIYQHAVTALALECRQPSSMLDTVLPRKELPGILLAIVEKELLDTVRSIHVHLLYVFSGLDNKVHAKELQNILGLQPGSPTRQSRLEAWIAAVATSQTLDWRVVAAMALGSPLPLRSYLSTNVQGESDEFDEFDEADEFDEGDESDYDTDDTDFASNAIPGLEVEPVVRIQTLDRRDALIPEDLQDLADILKPEIHHRFVEWVQVLRELPCCTDTVSRVYQEMISRMSFLASGDVVEGLANRISKMSSHDTYIVHAIRNLRTFVVSMERDRIKNSAKAAVVAGFHRLPPGQVLPAGNHE